MKRFLLFLKGMAMGTADVIPGVSGGTMALVLGIYRELVETIKNLSPRILFLILRWLKGRPASGLDSIRKEVLRMNLEFMFILLAGIGTAIVIGSAVIPSLMDSYPVAMRAFFFGLILASVYVPLKMVGSKSTRTLIIVGLTGVFGVGIGYTFTNPSHTFETTSRFSTVVSIEGESLKDLTRRGPSAWSSDRVFWAPENAPLRAAFSHENPEAFSKLEALHQAQQDLVVDKETMKARALPYEELILPANVSVQVPQPAVWFVFVAGLVAICAMILPGISGSYILLIFGLYFFILNALKGFLSTLASGSIPIAQGTYVLVFCLGCLIGILSFARLLSYLLRKHAAPTLGILVGLMIGCLRGIWPFRGMEGGIEVNVIPASFDASVSIALICCVAGMAIVGGITWLGHKKSAGVSHA